MRWQFQPLDAAAAGALGTALRIGAPAARVLCARGVCDPDEARRFLSPSLDDLHDPSLLKGMPPALERIRQAIARNEQILIYGDYDVDGTTSVIILKKAIEMAGGRAGFHIPDRLKEGYGMRPEVIERAAASGFKLFISVDTGIRGAETVRRASELGIDFIVTDHHLPEEELPPALAVINPNQPGCPYPEKNLCGVGVAFKLAQGILSASGRDGARVRRTLESFLKLVAIGTVADVVPLTGENRIIVKHGLEGLRSVRNPGLRALLDLSGFTEGVAPTASQVAFRIAPRLNAAGRMASANDVIELFLTGDPGRAETLARRLHDWNLERQQTEAAMVRSILDSCEETPVTEADAALVFSGDGWHRGVLGIVATRIVERFNRPVFVLSHDPETGLVQGSGRSIPAFHLLDALEHQRDLLIRFGGHRYAAGLTLDTARLEEFRSRLNRYASELLTPEDFEPVLMLDAPLAVEEINERAIAEVLSLGPFGNGNPMPVFGICGVEVAGPPVVVKDKHLRIALRQGSRTLSAIAWNQASETEWLRSGGVVDAAVSFDHDSRSASLGYLPWSAQVRRIRPHAAAAEAASA